MGNAVGSVSHGTLNGVNNATGVGHGSLASITEADDVTCLGRNAGGALTTGSNNVLIGSNSTILPVNICKGSVIGAGSVVTKNIKKKGIYAGNPAKFIRKI